MAYVKPTKFVEMRNYAKEYMKHWVIPLDLTFRSMMRSFETGLSREGRRKRAVLKHVYSIDDKYSLIEFKGKGGVVRKVEVPYNKDTIVDWYERAKGYRKESYRLWLYNKWGYGTHDGRRTGIINFLVLHGKTTDAQLEILSRTGHKSLTELMPYIREYVTLKHMLEDSDIENIKNLMEHIKV